MAPDGSLDSGIGAEAAGFYSRIRRARLWLPAAIAGVVLAWQLAVAPLGGPAWQFWSVLLFYSIVGPAVTFVVLDWIASEVRQREEAQARLSDLYTELRDSHELLARIQRVTESFAAAPDLEAVLTAAGRGVTEVTGARGATVLLDFSGVRLSQTHGLEGELAESALRRAAATGAAGARLERVTVADAEYWVLRDQVVWAGRPVGSVQAWFDARPDARQREAFGILAVEFSAAAEAASARMRDIYILADVDRSLRAEGNLGRLLDSLLLQMTNRAGAATGGVYLADEDGLLHLAAARVPGKRPTAPPIRPGQGLIGSVATGGEPLLLGSLQEPLPADESPLLAAAGSALVLPMQLEGALLGVVVLAHPGEDRFHASEVPLLELLAGQVSWAVRNARAYLRSEELAIAEERARIAREIHDGVAQSLAFTALRLDLIDRLKDREPEKATVELAATRATVRELIREVRRSIFALRPVDLERHGFAETLRRYATDYGQQNDIFVDIAIADGLDLPVKAEATLFRIFQEAMNNVAKHAAARSVRIVVGVEGKGDSGTEMAFIEVGDDGKGFDMAGALDRETLMGGIGLRQMLERVEAQGGVLRVDTAPGAGTRIRAELPV